MLEVKQRKRRLITMHDAEGKPLSLDLALLGILELLSINDSKKLIENLGEIGNILYENECDKANIILVNKFCTESFKNLILPLKKSDGTEDFLFTLYAMKLLNSFLVLSCNQRLVINFEKFTKKNNIHLPLQTSTNTPDNLPVVDMFLLINQIVAHLQEAIDNMGDEFLANTALYYSHAMDDTNAAIGRSRLLHNTNYFNQKLQNDFGMSVLEISEYLFILFSLVNVNKPAKIETEFTFRKINNDIHKLNIKKILDSLSIEIQSTEIKYSEILTKLHTDFIQDRICRGKPFLKIQDRYICIRPDLLTSAIGNFPYFYLLNNLPESEKKTLFDEYGNAFDLYIEDISKRALRETSQTYTYKRKPHKGNKSSDRHLVVNENTRAIIEVKSSREDDDVLLGSLEDIKRKYIHLDGSAEKPKGVLQLIKDAKKFREDSEFSGEIYTIIIFYGKFPETNNFDTLVEKEISSKTEYQDYLADTRNHPTIWLSSDTAELIFNAVIQKASIEEILKRLAGIQPSKIRFEILNYLSENNFRSSLSHLFKEELNILLSKSKKMLIS